MNIPSKLHPGVTVAVRMKAVSELPGGSQAWFNEDPHLSDGPGKEISLACCVAQPEPESEIGP